MVQSSGFRQLIVQEGGKGGGGPRLQQFRKHDFVRKRIVYALGFRMFAGDEFPFLLVCVITCTPTHAYLYIYVYVYVHVHVCTCMCMYMYLYAHIHTDTHTRIGLDTHVYNTLRFGTAYCHHNMLQPKPSYCPRTNNLTDIGVGIITNSIHSGSLLYVCIVKPTHKP